MIATQALTSQKTSGLICIALLALLSYAVVNLPLFATSGISSLVAAIVLGIGLGNAWTHPVSLTPGIQFAAKRLLRTAIVLYGFRVNFQQIASVGLEAILIDCLMVGGTLSIGYLLGRKLFKLDKDLSLLISAGAAICGAAAVLAVEDILKSEPHKTAVAIGTVVLFGTISMFVYPMIQHAGWLGFTDNQFGIFAGASVHEVAQALVTGANISPDASQVAVIVKMLRVLLLVPVLFLLAHLQRKRSDHTSRKPLTIPWFALGFLGVIAFNSLQWLPQTLVTLINQLDIILLTMAMAAIGMETKLAKIKKVGLNPLYLATFLFFWLFTSAFVLVKSLIN